MPLPQTSTPPRPRLNTIVARWLELLGSVCNPYRPELHYMRGPGPKWRAKHQELASLAGLSPIARAARRS
jgi:hypothetical protein